MAFRPSNIPEHMSIDEYEKICFIEQLRIAPLEVPPPVRKKKFLSANEIKLLSYLMKWCPNFIVLTQVHLLQMIKIDERDIDQNFMQNYEYIFEDNARKAYWAVFNMVNLLSVDFVLADRVGNPVYAIEIDGKEHESDLNLIQRDKIKAYVLNEIGVPLLKIKNTELAILSKLQAKIVSFAQ